MAYLDQLHQWNAKYLDPHQFLFLGLSMAMKLSVKPEAAEVLPGATVTFAAVIRGTPPFKIAWYKEGTELTQGKDCNITLTDSLAVLEMYNVSTSQSGNYSCHISNDAGKDSCTTQLFKLNNYQIDAGKPIVLECTYTGTLPISVTWQKNGVEITQSERCSITTTEKSWLCCLLEPPYFIAPLEPVEVTAGDAASLQCQIQGTPEIKVSWYKGDTKLRPTDTQKILFKNNIARLVFAQVDVNDSGEYICKAENLVGEASSSTSLSVKGKNTCLQYDWRTCTPPVFDKPLAPVTVTEGEGLQLSCHVEGSQPIRIQWLKAGREIKSSNTCNVTFIRGTATLELKAALKTDAGDYLCKATNSAGSESWSPFPLPVSDTNSSPAFRTHIVNILHQYSALVTWNRPKDGGKPIFAYILEKRETMSNRWAKAAKEPIYPDSQYKVTELLEGCEYEFRVSAQNEVGVGDASPPSKPFFAKDPIGMGILMSVLKHDGGGKIIGYLVEYQKVGEEEWKKSNFAPDGCPDTKHTVVGLTEGDTYKFRIMAVNAAGESEPAYVKDPVQAKDRLGKL
uniref:Myomesin 2 n=1 Tax=Xenopus tropicalis TaxID=8364 RepID=A0A803JW69_XENTR